MTNTASNAPHSLGASIAALRPKWGWIVAMGSIFVLAGFFALGSALMATIATVYYIGFAMLVAGLTEIFCAFQMKSWGGFFMWLFLGALYTLAGVLTFQNPLLAASTLTLILGAALLATGLVRIYLAFQMKEGTPWVMVALSGVITTFLGASILAHWPTSSLYVLGIFLGIDLVFAGFGWINFGYALKQRA